MKKKLYIFQNSFYARKVRVSGGDTRLVNIIKKNLHRIDQKSRIFVSREGYEFDRRSGLKLGFSISPLLFDFLGIYICYALRTMWLIFKLFFMDRRNVIFYSSSDFFPDTLAPFLFKAKNNMWVQIIHHLYLPPSRRKGNRLRNLIGYLAQKGSLFLIKSKADKVVVVDPLLKDVLPALGVNREKIVVSSNGINYDYFKNLGEENKNFAASFLGRLTPAKGAFDLVPIWSKVVEKRPAAKLLIVGGSDPAVKKRVENSIAACKLKNNVELVGYQEDGLAFKMLKQSRLFIFPSHEEGWGIAIAEAMASKLLPVCWDLEKYRSIFGNNIVRIKEGDIDSFGKSILFYLENDSSREKAAADACEFISKYDWTKVAENEWGAVFQ